MGADPDITGIAVSSREVKPGYLFAAIPGTKLDGRTFIPDAIRAGAAAILVPEGAAPQGDIPFITVRTPRSCVGKLASKFYQPQPKHIVAVTGTNGKTSTAHFCRQLWQLSGHDAASIGTLGVVDKHSKHGVSESNLTTPDVVTLHRELARLKGGGVDHIAMEASSHGLDQERLCGVEVMAAGISNISRDHLDYHSTMEDYKQAKYRLFTEVLKKGGTAVINADIPEADEIKALCAARRHDMFTYGFKGEQLHLRELKPVLAGQEVKLDIFHKPYSFSVGLIGEFQISNILCALGLVIASGMPPEEALAAVQKVTPVPGRMQLAATHASGAPILVDYAHTPDALEKLLQAARNHVQTASSIGRLHVVFGCGGDRDKGKRPVMGDIAATLADIVIVTDDNPRTELPAAIRAEIMQGCAGAKEIGDREEAIRTAVKGLRKGDMLLIAGKGHEDYQIIGTEKRHFSDVEIAKEAVKG